MTYRYEIADRLRQVLTFLAVSGGAALLSKREARVLAEVGDIESASVVASLNVPIENDDAVTLVAPGRMLAEVGLHHRLLVLVPKGLPDPAFLDRLRRARDLILRFGLQNVGPLPPRGAPPRSAPAHAFVFGPSRVRQRLPH